MEVLDLIQMGYEVRDHKNNTIEDFRLVDSKSAHAIRQNITKEMIRDFLQTKEVYQVMKTPTKRKSFNWTIVENKCIKWQMDVIYLGSYLKKELGWGVSKVQANKGRTYGLPSVAPDSHGIVLH